VARWRGRSVLFRTDCPSLDCSGRTAPDASGPGDNIIPFMLSAVGAVLQSKRSTSGMSVVMGNG
jgi:hypothetical protein